MNTKELSRLTNNTKENLTTVQFADKINIPAAYLADIIKEKIKEYPSKNILKRISNGSENIYNQLLNICEYNETKYNNQEIKRMQIYWVDLGETVGSEQGGKRPVLIIQNDIGNKYSPTVIVAVITSQINKVRLPTHVILNSSCGLEKESAVFLEQQRTIDKQRICEYGGTVSDKNDIKAINKAMKIEGGLKEELNDQRVTQLVKSLIIINKKSKESKELKYIKSVLTQEFKKYCDLCDLDYKNIYSEYYNKIIAKSYNYENSSVENVRCIPAYAM